MPGGAEAVRTGTELRQKVAELGMSLGLQVRTEVRVGRRIWGSERKVDVVITQRESRRSLGLECKFQKDRGTVDQKIPATIADLSAWPIPGIVVIAGEGFYPSMRAYLMASGKVVEFDELETWLRWFFGID
jgi:PD-(D/E)XK nuclease superfamily protein